jgi:aminomethyltransferase
MPVRYDSDLAEHHAVRERVGMFDISHMAEISVNGAQAGEFLDFAVAGKMSALALGQAKYTLLLTEAGTVIDDLIIYRLGEQHWLVVANAGNRFAALDALTARTAGFSVDVVDQSDETAMIAVQGPSALAVLESTVGLSLAEAAASRPESTLADLKYYWTLPAVFEGNPVLIARTGYTGEDGFELYIDAVKAADLWVTLGEAGEKFGMVPCGLACRDTLRLEAGMPLYGHELTLDVRPAQAGLGKVVAMSKEGDFVGRTASEKDLPADAPVLVALVGEGKRAARADYELFVGDEKVGIVTSGALSPTLGFPIALAYIHPAHSAVGHVIDVDVRGTRIPFTVSTLPFYRRKKD